MLISLVADNDENISLCALDWRRMGEVEKRRRVFGATDLNDASGRTVCRKPANILLGIYKFIPRGAQTAKSHVVSGGKAADSLGRLDEHGKPVGH